MGTLGGLYTILGICLSINIGNFWYYHNSILQKNENNAVGSGIVLNDKERIANDYLMKLKIAEIEAGLKDPENFPPALHFFQAKDKIDKSKVFEILKKLPKGATLYSHDAYALSDNVIFNLTYKDNLYGCFIKEVYRLKYFKEKPDTNECNWTSLCDLRKCDPNFDTFLRSQLTLKVDDPYKAYPTVLSVWNKYEAVSITLKSLLSYKPVLEEFLYQTLKEAYEDNVIYYEALITLSEVYDSNGKTYNEKEVVEIYAGVLDKFLCDYPDYFLAKMVFTPINVVDNITLSTSIDTYLNMKKLYPKVFSGFELSCIDSSHQPIADFLPQIFRLIKNSVRLYYHGKEIHWYDKNNKINVMDAVLLDATRIGHSDVVIKNEIIGKLVKEKNIGLELAPIANQVLKFSDNVKSNPGSVAIAQGYPVIITSDDGSFWGSKGLSYDWYIAFMGLAEECQDLRFLKQLALNSLYHSGFDNIELKQALKIWKNQWCKFIDEICLIASSNNV